MRLQEILDRQAAIRTELSRLDNDPETTEEDQGDLRDSLVAEFKNLDDRAKPIIKRMEDIRAIKVTAGDEANLERTQDEPEFALRTRATYGNGGPDLVVRTKRDPFYDLESVKNHTVTRSEMIGRAQDAIERYERQGVLKHEYAENAAQRAQHSTSISRHYLLTGSEEYREAFHEYLRTGDSSYMTQRAFTLGTGSLGFSLPFVLDPTVVLTNASSANPWRRISRVVQTTSNTWNGVNSAGVTGAWLTEAAVAADNSPTVGQIQITPEKAAAWVFGSYESIDDSSFADQLPALLNDAKDRLEEAAFTAGSGSAGVPMGLLTALGGATGAAPYIAQAATTATVTAPSIYAANAGLPPRFRLTNNAAWLANIFTINAIRQLDVYGGGTFWSNLGQGSPDQLLGKPIYESTTMSSGTAAGTGGTDLTGNKLVFGSFDNFLIVDRVGTTMIYEPLLKGTGANAQLPSGQSGWFYHWRVGAGVTTTAAFRSVYAT